MKIATLRRRQVKWLLGVAFLSGLAGTAAWRTYVATIPQRRNQAMVRTVSANNIELVQQYLAQGADPNTVFRYLDEPYVSRCYSPRAIWIRIRGGPGAPMMRNGPTTLMKAVETGNPQMVQLLLKYGADVNAVGWYGYTALSEAQDAKDAQIVQMLKRAGARK